MDDHQRVYRHGRCYLISIQSDEGGVLEYIDDEINREIFRTQSWHGLGRKGIKILWFCLNDFFLF